MAPMGDIAPAEQLPYVPDSSGFKRPCSSPLVVPTTTAPPRNHHPPRYARTSSSGT
eukprot:CAMPEP_0202875138 /NCGR_PEP_ID=MMETSP1391-20130828/26693_1 /ASSEMBLY_ACC=CAM_ASM_000867 /TAXON_ID=1034604 /ORGANISM="Chlamydomonas leiostraca, Strain SAG 11-49" /LENGTH=55 /DNA_ID=CAMNT_0049556753 /DNA_START=1001 /DNA_END=1165 /DNA_ORIENTATION=+